MIDIEGTGKFDPETNMILVDETLELGIDDIRTMRLTVAAEDFKKHIEKVFDEEFINKDNDIIQFDVPLTMTFTITKQN